MPGLLGVILTMTMVLMTWLALTRERERGTYENLLAHARHAAGDHDRQDRAQYAGGHACSRPSCWLLARIYLRRAGAGVAAACWRWASPSFIIANLAVGYTFSTIAQNQLQAMQMTVFFLLPSILLSGFAFPFAGMPIWAQWLGEVLPATHFLRIARGVLLEPIPQAECPYGRDRVRLYSGSGQCGTVQFRRTLVEPVSAIFPG